MTRGAGVARVRRIAGSAGRWAVGARVAWLGFGVVVGLAVGLFAVPVVASGPGRDAGSGDLVIMIDYDQSVGQQRLALIEEWANAHDRSVDVVQIPSSATAAHSQLVAHAQSGAGGVDVYSLDITWIAEFVSEEWIEPLDRSTVDADEFLDAPLRAGELDGQLWALPFNTDAGLLYCNRSLLPGCDEPVETWQDLRRRVEQGRQGEAAGVGTLAGQFADYEGFTVNVLEAILVEDPTALDSGDGLNVDTATVEALRGLADRFGSGFMLEGSLEHREADSTDAFAAGQAVFMRNWPVAYRQLTAAEEGDDPRMATRDVGVARLPGPSVLGGQSLAVARGSEHRRAAQDLIEFLTGARSQQKLFEEGGFAPTRKVIYHDQDLREDFPYLDDLRVAVEGAKLRPVHPRYERFSEALRRIVRPSLASEAAPTLFETDLVQGLDDALQGYRRE